MSRISVLGGGAFGTSLALALSGDDTPVTLWTRDRADAAHMLDTGISGRRLPGHAIPPTMRVTDDLQKAGRADICLIAVPMQALRGFAATLPDGHGTLVACCKGVDLKTGLGPVETLRAQRPETTPALLTGPSFAADIARGLPTALILAAEDDQTASQLQEVLARPLLRLYRTDDVIGAELGGALKNVIALAAGMAIGAGFGDSARASVIARGFAEMTRYGVSKGARADTFQGLSGLGDLVLTCTSEKSRNFTAGQKIGSGENPGASTIEGIATAAAVAERAAAHTIDMPITPAVAAVTQGKMDVNEAVAALLSRPLSKE